MWQLCREQAEPLFPGSPRQAPQPSPTYSHSAAVASSSIAKRYSAATLCLPSTTCWVFEVPRCDPTPSPGVMRPAWVIFLVTFRFVPKKERAGILLFVYNTVLNWLSTEIMSLWVTCLLGCKLTGFVRYYKKSGVHFPVAWSWNTRQVFLPLTINSLALLVL